MGVVSASLELPDCAESVLECALRRTIDCGDCRSPLGRHPDALQGAARRSGVQTVNLKYVKTKAVQEQSHPVIHAIRHSRQEAVFAVCLAAPMARGRRGILAA